MELGGKLSEVDSLEVPKADDFFTDRDEPREVFASFFERLYKSKVRGDSGQKSPLLNFYGVGGVGKSSLLKEAQAEFHTKYCDQTDYSQVLLVSLNLAGLQLGKDIPSYELFWKLRNELLHDNLRTTLFDSIYLRIWHADHPGQKMELPKTKSQDWADIGLENAAEFMGGTMVLKVARVLWGKTTARKTFNRVQRILNGKSPEECDRRELEKGLPLFLAADILHAFESNPLLRVALCIDEYEQIQEPKTREMSAESCLLELLGEVLTKPAIQDRFAVVVMGREKLRWDRVYNAAWQPLIESHILSGLSEQDARTFLIDKIAPWLVANKQQATAQALIDHQDGILKLMNSGPEKSRDGCLPLHLDLIVSVACKEAEKFTPALLVNPEGQRERIEERFLKYWKRSDEPRLEALQILAFAPAFDRSLFDYLLSCKVIINYRIGDFAKVLGGEGELTDSFVRQHPSWPGYYVFHGLMKVSLVNSNLNTSFGTSGVTERLQKLLQFYIDGAQFNTLAEASELHQRMVTLGFDVIRSDASKRLLSVEEIYDHVCRLINSFDSESFQTHNLLLPVWEWLVNYLIVMVGAEHNCSQAAIEKFAWATRDTGNYVSARKLQEQLLEIRQIKLGKDHQQTIKTMEDLASTLACLNEQSGAKELYEKVLGTRKRMIGNEHPETIEVMARLAGILHFLGDHSAETVLKEQIVDIYQRIHGPNHSVTLFAMNSLALTLYILGETKRAEELTNLVIETCESGQNPEQPETLAVLEAVAGNLEFYGDYVRAKGIYERCLASCQRSLGLNHPETIGAMLSLAHILDLLNDESGAIAIKEQIVGVYRGTYGPEHHATLSSIQDLALTLEFAGHSARAKDLYAKVLDAHQRTLGPDDQETLLTTSFFAYFLRKNDDQVGAKVLFEQLVDAYKRTLGSNHPNTISAMEDLASTLNALNDYGEANGLYEQVVTARKNTLGQDHPDTLRAIAQVARQLGMMGDYIGAKHLIEQILDARRRGLGLKHPEALLSEIDLAWILHNLGDTQRVKKITSSVYATCLNDLEPDHPETLAVMESLAFYLGLFEDYAGEIAVYKLLVDARQRIHGANHPDTISAMESLSDAVRASK
jgi:tetratricopeptide (TPR) repeat protein